MTRDVLRPIASALIVSLPTLVGGCAPGDEQPASSDSPVLIVAVDGFEWSVILPLVRAGRMPACAELMRRGTFGTLRPMTPSKSPRLWTTIATGKPPAEHGILGFTRADEGGGEVLYTSSNRRVKAFWNILSDHGVSSDTIGWWVTFPAERVDGSMVSQTNTRSGDVRKGAIVDGLHGQVWPEELEREVFAALEATERGLDDQLERIFDFRPREALPALREKWGECRWSFRADATYVAVLRARLERGPPSRVTSLYIGGTDVVGHRFWTALEPDAFDPRPDRREIEAFEGVIPRYYEHVDAVLAELLERFPGDTNVMIVADHGMRRGEHHGAEPGAFLVAGPAFVSSGARPDAVALDDMVELGRLVDVCPTLLALVGVPFGEDMLGRPLEGLFEASFLERHPPRAVPTHDDTAWAASRSDAVRRDAERLEQLRQLGYLGDE